MKIIDVCSTNKQVCRNSEVSCKSKVHIIDGFLHADNMEHGLQKK